MFNITTYNIYVCVWGRSQPIDSDALGEEFQEHSPGLYYLWRAPTDIPHWSQCCAWTSPCGSCNCKTHLSKKPSESFEEEDVSLPGCGGYMARPTATQRDHGEMEWAGERERIRNSAFIRVQGLGV